MIILGLETSCDETAAALVKNGTTIISSVISSQIDIHNAFGGVVPEVAARSHVEAIVPVINNCLLKAKLALENIDAIAVTQGPGLIGSLVIGVETGKALSWATQKPIIGVNHLIGHIYANWLNNEAVSLPALCLLVSGGHTILLKIKSHSEIIKIGQTLDDAAGEAFDKVAKIMGLNYPGGPEISRISTNGNPKAYNFPRALLTNKEKREGNYNFSFSGLKTAVLNTVKKSRLDPQTKADIAASFEHAVADALITKLEWILDKDKSIKTVMLAGGVAANQTLKKELGRRMHERGFDGATMWPDAVLATDNATMIAAAAYFCPNFHSPQTLTAFASGNDRLNKS
jgi:N6-L-threonylcarbamoyladenine synthase